jgi:hypothetical protein
LLIAQPIDYLFGLLIKYPINALYILVFPVCELPADDAKHIQTTSRTFAASTTTPSAPLPYNNALITIEKLK